MDNELNVQELENQKPIELASNAGISRSQYLTEQNAVQANDAVNKALERVNEESGSMEELMRSLAGESSFRAEAEDIAGVGSTQKRLNELAALSNAETRSLTKDILGNELDAMGTRETRGFLDAKDARARRESAIRSLTIASEAELLQGNLEQAQALVDRAVSAKFEPIKQELEIRKFNLDRLDKTLLEPAQKRQAEATKRKLDQELNEVEKTEEVTRTLVENGMPPSLFSKLEGKSYGEIITTPELGKYLTDPLEKAIKNKQLDKLTAEINKLNAPINIPTVEGSNNSTITKILNSATNENDLTSSERETLSKMSFVIDQLDTLQSTIQKSNKTGLIKGRVNNILANIGADADAGSINAQLQALVPNVARGIYGEVGVLTNADIENYKKTLPNLKTVEDQNDAVLALTLKNAARSYENVLVSAANSNVNVSGWAQDYADITNKINEIEDRIGVTTVRINDFTAQNPTALPMVEELINAGASDREIASLLGI